MDNKLTNGLILNRLLDPAQEVNREGITCYGLWTGDDGLTPSLFAESHSHYLVSGSDVIDSGDLAALAFVIAVQRLSFRSRQPGSSIAPVIAL
ncbi:hypothetical protein AFM11_33490 [Mycolicibacterium wolinskyi]|uniref:Uncharacterized protein n=1 Tax=Mycolicibacterium wolinskyi TaxID=59750 RepID=A0A132PC34_9MYCO|nr:hypothetical protein [Mycolicibacterium wolinskyi]KWX19895.1 hypothetical protein AFM11_33490 [Mycolicibacterium wolinskyi]